MGHKIITATLVVLILATSLCSSAYAYRIINDNYITSDSDNVWTRRHFIGYQQVFKNNDGTTKVTAQLGSISVSEDNELEQLDVVRIRSEYDIKNTHLSLRLASAAQSSWQPVLAGATLSGTPSDNWYIELFSDRELVDSIVAIRNKLLLDTYGISADYKINAEFTAVGALYKQAFTDDNRRVGRVLRLIYTPELYDGFNVQLRSKRLTAKKKGIGYFSPLVLEEYWLISALSKTLLSEKWLVKLQAGLGQQKIDSINTNNTFMTELAIRGWKTDHFGLVAKIGYTNNGSFSTSTSGSAYQYRYMNLSLIGNW